MLRNCKLFILLLLLISCSLSKDVKKSESEKQGLQQVDSIGVRKTNVSQNSSLDFERLIERFKPVVIPGDTNVFNFPVERIYERGSKAESKQSNTVDSAARQAIVAIAEMLKEKDKQESVEGFSFWHLIGVAALGLVLGLFLPQLKLGFKNGKAG